VWSFFSMVIWESYFWGLFVIFFLFLFLFFFLFLYVLKSNNLCYGVCLFVWMSNVHSFLKNPWTDLHHILIALCTTTSGLPFMLISIIPWICINSSDLYFMSNRSELSRKRINRDKCRSSVKSDFGTPCILLLHLINPKSVSELMRKKYLNY